MTIIAHKCQCGIDSINYLLNHIYGISIEKTEPDPLTEDGFIVLIGRMLRKILNSVLPYEGRRLTQAIDSLARRIWTDMSSLQMDNIIESSAQLLPNPSHTARLIMPILRSEGANLIQMTRQSAIATHGFNIGADMAMTDRRIAEFITSSQSFYISNRTTGRNEMWSQRARHIVSNGVAQGLDRNQIASDLRNALGPSRLLGQSRGYYEVIASSYSAHARSFTHLTSMGDAGIDRFQFEAVLDQRTSEVCRFYHGQVFSVPRARERYTQLQQSQDPEEIQNIAPWVRTRRNPEGKNELYVRYRNGAEVVLATVFRSGMDTTRRGAYSNPLSSAQLELIGIPTPPLHGRCRSSIQPIF